jgi:small subunit ribosomal protein S11
MSDKTKAVDMSKTATKTEKKEVKIPVIRAKKKQQRFVEKGRIYINATFNNTICTVTDDKGNAIAWGSSGASGFKGARKSTPYAATTAVDNVIRKCMTNFGLKEVEVYVKGPGSGRDASLRAIKPLGLRISKIADITPIAHNGPRPKKKRRI